MHGAMLLVARKKLQAQCFELVRHGVHIEGAEHHGSGTTGHHITNLLIRHRLQAARNPHGLRHGDEIGSGIEQGTVHVEQNSAQAHQDSLTVWTM